VAGCGTGEEAWSLAMALHEEGLLGRATVYATDIDTAALRVAEAGVYPLQRMARFAEGYALGGGRGAVTDLCSATPAGISVAAFLRPHVVFFEHSLATDAAFVDAQLVSCRNVLIYFDAELQARVVGLLRASLQPRGFLGLGARETLGLSGHAGAFERHATDAPMYRLRSAWEGPGGRMTMGGRSR
jgi:chemotaxis protein methyltransferase CheR